MLSETRCKSSGSVLAWVAGALSVAGIGLFGAYAVTVRGAGLAGAPVESKISPEVLSSLETAAARALETRAVLTFDGRRVERSWKELGLVVDKEGLPAAAAAAGVTVAVPPDHFRGKATPVVLDRARALEAFAELRSTTDRPPRDARIDLDNLAVLPEIDGVGIDVYASLAAVEVAARAGRVEVALVGGPKLPRVTRASLGDIDLTNVMGWFETPYPFTEKDRNHNLRIAGEKLNGYVLQPGQLFSFNEVVGERSEKQGYRVAHVISAGEMVDGLAGGACQISSTLHGASWFAGLEIVAGRPHSRPSAYITMGLDATVVWPNTDLKLKNPYPFPVVIHYTVAQGKVRAEILGKPRPWKKVAFEREILEEIPFETVSRPDPEMPLGSTIIDQPGFPGYKLIRRRVFYTDQGAEKTEKWNLDYPPTTQYVRVGSNPDPNLVPPKQPPIHGPMDPGDTTYEMVR